MPKSVTPDPKRSSVAASFRDIIKQLPGRPEQSKVAQWLGVPNHTVSNWNTRKRIPLEAYQRLREVKPSMPSPAELKLVVGRMGRPFKLGPAKPPQELLNGALPLPKGTSASDLARTVAQQLTAVLERLLADNDLLRAENERLMRLLDEATKPVELTTLTADEVIRATVKESPAAERLEALLPKA